MIPCKMYNVCPVQEKEKVEIRREFIRIHTCPNLGTEYEER